MPSISNFTAASRRAAQEWDLQMWRRAQARHRHNGPPRNRVERRTQMAIQRRAGEPYSFDEGPQEFWDHGKLFKRYAQSTRRFADFQIVYLSEPLIARAPLPREKRVRFERSPSPGVWRRI